MEQKIISAENNYRELDNWFLNHGLEKVLLVCGKSIARQSINEYFETVQNRLGVKVFRFMDFAPNPLYESVVNGVEVFRQEGCRGIIAVGGGSAMDVAKCIKLYSNMQGNSAEGDFLRQKIVPNDVPFLAMPTTAGTGSEATRFAVIYYDGAKQSVADPSCIPGTVLMDSSVLKTLPEYQKKSTMMDALCHGIESFWSVNSTEESREFSREAIEMIIANKDAYLLNMDEGNAAMLRAANLAGKAINITQTTAGHAMCYKITSLFGCAHGHAAALCDRILLQWMIENTEKCIDSRGREYLDMTLNEIGLALGCKDAASGAEKFLELFYDLGLEVPAASEEQFRTLKTSVNSVRLKNHPIALDEETIDTLYRKILRTEA
ncbi:MAG: phosphonoacetaldehyde reductase [Clostridia bacterium]|nr:phosphonoacetaldehyde reductase [Clostridia bacterium]